MRSIMKDKSARFMPFWIMLGLLGVLLIGAYITPFKIVLDDIFRNMNSNADSKLTCTDPDAYWYIKSTCFTLGGFMVVFILYLLYNWVSAMVNGARHPGRIFSARNPESLLSERRLALES